MNSRALRRLAADHNALHNQPLPPNYLFPPNATSNDDLSELDILLAGPTHTPFASGVWKLHLTIPTTYPQQPPAAHFRTQIFHPNVEPQTGAVCVETLKRDWESKLTLRDVLVTICCLLIQPNPDSALNAEAGQLIQEDFESFARRAELMTGIHAAIPRDLKEAVREAQERGQDKASVQENEDKDDDVAAIPPAPVRRRRPTAKQRGTVTFRRSDGSPSGGLGRSRRHADLGQPFVVQTGNDDVFGGSRQAETQEEVRPQEDDDSSMMDADQENDESKSPTKAKSPAKASTPKRPQGLAVPLGELTMDEVRSSDSSEEDDMEAEYPPSPRKSPLKSPAKPRKQPIKPDETTHAESSRDAVRRAPNITPPSNLFSKPLTEDSPFVNGSPSPRKTLFRPQTPASASKKALLFPQLKATPQTQSKGIMKKRSPSSSEKKRNDAKRKVELDDKLWELCGRDIKRWNRGDFGEGVFKTKAKRW